MGEDLDENQAKLDLRPIIEAFEQTVKASEGSDGLEVAVDALLDAVKTSASQLKIAVKTWPPKAEADPTDAPPDGAAATELHSEDQEERVVTGAHERCLRFVAPGQGISIWPDPGGGDGPTCKRFAISLWLKADPDSMKHSLDKLMQALSTKPPAPCEVGHELCLQLDLPYLVRLLAAALIELRRGNFESVVGSVMYALSAVANAVYISDGSSEFRVDRPASLVFCQSRTLTEDGFLINGELSLPDEFGTAAGSTFIRQKVHLRLGDEELSNLQSSVEKWVNPPKPLVGALPGAPRKPATLGDDVLVELWNGLTKSSVTDGRNGLNGVSNWLNKGMRASDETDGARVTLDPQWDNQKNSATAYVMLNLNGRTRARFSMGLADPMVTLGVLSEAINQVKVEAQKPRQ